MANPQVIYQSKKGINLVDGYYLTRNPHTKMVSFISIRKGVVYIHDITRQMGLADLVHYDSAGFLEVYDSLEQTEVLKQKKKNKKDNEKW